MAPNCDDKSTSCVTDIFGKDKLALFEEIQRCREAIDRDDRDACLIKLFKRTKNFQEVTNSLA